MNVGRVLKVIAVTMGLSLAALSPCYAARIYNELSDEIYVQGISLGGLDPTVRYVQPGQRSDSLDWTANSVIVQDRDGFGKKLCGLNFGFHRQIVGGNYMVVSKSGQNINCVVCDSNHNAIVGAGSC